MLIVEISLLKDSKLWLWEGLHPDNIPWEKQHSIGLYPFCFITMKKFKDC